MIFFNKIVVLNDGKPCGCATFTQEIGLSTIKISSINVDESKNYAVRIKKQEKTVLDTVIFGKNLKSFKISFDKDKIQNNNITFEIDEAREERKAKVQKTETEKYENNSTKTTPDIPFFETVRLKVEKMLEEHEKFPLLEEKFEHSKWVMVPFDESGLYYAFGIIYGGDGRAKYICCAIPSSKDAPPPKHLEEYCTFTEIGESGNGFYIMKQKAETGEYVK